MRLIGTLTKEEAKRFSRFLLSKNIECKIEETMGTDWGSETYGTILSQVWIIREDDLTAAHKWLEKFKQEGTSAEFDTPESEEEIPPDTMEPPSSTSSSAYQEVSRKLFKGKTRLRERTRALNAPITLYILFSCVWLFILSRHQVTLPEDVPNDIPKAVLFTSPLDKEMFFDYPQSYVLADKLIKLYGLEKLNRPLSLPAQGQHLYHQFRNTPHWTGFYDRLVQELQNGDDSPRKVRLFEKIREGEVWRIFTPCLLHNDIFHLFFNMAWLLILGRQVESRIGGLRYVLMILTLGIFSNFAQYLASGPNFIGFSGILCGMITFVWFRQKRAPWEGYQLHPSTMGFITFFILALFSLQFAAFIAEVTTGEAYNIGIANTAHLSGALGGYLFSRLKFFQWKPVS